MILSMANIDEWIPFLERYLFKCVKYDATVSVTPIFRGVWVKFQLICPVHGKNETRLIPLAVYNRLMQLKELKEQVLYKAFRGQLI